MRGAPTAAPRSRREPIVRALRCQSLGGVLVDQYSRFVSSSAFNFKSKGFDLRSTVFARTIPEQNDRSQEEACFEVKKKLFCALWQFSRKRRERDCVSCSSSRQLEDLRTEGGPMLRCLIEDDRDVFERVHLVVQAIGVHTRTQRHQLIKELNMCCSTQCDQAVKLRDSVL